MRMSSWGVGLALGLLPGLGTAAAADEQLDEIVVTATKTGAVSPRSIPAGISALTGNTLEESGIHSLDELPRLIPSLQMGIASPGDLQPIIRGIQSPGAGTVGVYFDETVITGVNFANGGGGTPDVGSYDIDRVEVLKGPQGTLFGASSMSGTVRFISNKPSTRDFDARISVRAESLDGAQGGYRGDVMLNAPLIKDTLAVRAVAWYDREGGYIDEYTGLNAVTKIPNANEIAKAGGRLMARFEPTEDLTLDAYGMYQKFTDFGPQGFSDVPSGTSLPIKIAVGAPFLIGLTVPGLASVNGTDSLTTPSASRSNSRITLYGMTLTYELPLGTIVATTSKYSINPYYFTLDTSGTSSRYGLVDFPAFFQTGKLFIDNPFDYQQQQVRDVESSEVRFSSKLHGPFKFVAGGYFQNEYSDTNSLVVAANPVTGQSLCQIWSQCIQNIGSPAAQSIVFADEKRYFVNAYALFAHADYEFTDKLTLGVGGRYFDSREHSVDYTGQGFQGSIPFTVPPYSGGPVETVPVAGLNTRVKESKPTGDVSLGYQARPDALVYFRAASGFRQGGPNDSVTAKELGVVIPDKFNPDTVYSYEIGAKTTWLDRRLTLDGALFRMNWQNMQVPGQDRSGVISFIENAAKSRVDGAELELAARPANRWHLMLGVTGLNARITENQAFEGGPVAVVGDRIPKVPKWAASATADYTLPWRVFGPVATTLRTNFSYTGRSMTKFNSSFADDQPIGDYFLMNVSVNFDYQNCNLRVFVNNLTDRRPVLDIFGYGVDLQRKITVPPRAIGAQFTWRLK
ncbi:MAG: TonB-dependent receptor [Steroidobacteraceae bacterium]